MVGAKIAMILVTSWDNKLMEISIRHCLARVQDDSKTAVTEFLNELELFFGISRVVEAVAVQRCVHIYYRPPGVPVHQSPLYRSLPSLTCNEFIFTSPFSDHPRNDSPHRRTIKVTSYSVYNEHGYIQDQVTLPMLKIIEQVFTFCQTC
jgi:hypothetical protein